MRARVCVLNRAQTIFVLLRATLTVKNLGEAISRVHVDFKEPDERQRHLTFQ